MTGRGWNISVGATGIAIYAGAWKPGSLCTLIFGRVQEWVRRCRGTSSVVRSSTAYVPSSRWLSS